MKTKVSSSNVRQHNRFNREVRKLNKMIAEVARKRLSQPNPFAVCTASVGRKDKAKYERCVLQVKSQSRPDLLSKEMRNQIRVGTKVEMEHTKDKRKARKIAIQHLIEHPDYYTKLAKCFGGKH